MQPGGFRFAVVVTEISNIIIAVAAALLPFLVVVALKVSINEKKCDAHFAKHMTLQVAVANVCLIEKHTVSCNKRGQISFSSMNSRSISLHCLKKDLRAH